jgi:hypothetical protein
MVPYKSIVSDIPHDAVIYPAVSSSAAKTVLRLIFSKSYSSTLAFECINQINRSAPNCRRNFLNDLAVFPGLNAVVENNYWFLVGPRKGDVREATAAAVEAPMEDRTDIVSSTDDELEAGAMALTNQEIGAMALAAGVVTRSRLRHATIGNDRGAFCVFGIV